MKTVYCSILYDGNINKGSLFNPKKEDFNLNDLIDWVKRNYSMFDELRINRDKQEILLVYHNYLGNIFKGDRYEKFCIKECK